MGEIEGMGHGLSKWKGQMGQAADRGSMKEAAKWALCEIVWPMKAAASSLENPKPSSPSLYLCLPVASLHLTAAAASSSSRRRQDRRPIDLR